LSKLARMVDHFAAKLQTQERLTTEIARALSEGLAPRGVGVMLEAEHLCSSVDGVELRGTKTVTSALTGTVRDDPALRAEFLTLARANARALATR